MAEGGSMITYQMLTSEDAGVTWHHKGTQPASSKEAALSKFFPKPRIVGNQYVAVASSHWQPVEEALREQTYTRKVQGLQPVEQTTIDEALATEPDDTIIDSQMGSMSESEQALGAEVLADEAGVVQTAPLQAVEEEEVPA